MNSELDITDQAARLRALDVLAEQHRRIVALAVAVAPLKRKTLNAAAELSWRSFSRAAFEERMADLGDRLVSVTVHLDDALDQCDRARATVLAGMPTERTASSVPDSYVGYPASAPSIPTFLPR